MNDHKDLEIAQLRTQNQMLSNELVARAQGTLGEITDALNAFAASANQGNTAAKGALKGFIEAVDLARDAASKLTIVRNGGASHPPT